MRLLGNIIWFFLGGWLIFLLYVIAAIVFFPMFIPLFRLAVFAVWPFGRAAITKAELNQYRQSKNIASNDLPTEIAIEQISYPQYQI